MKLRTKDSELNTCNKMAYFFSETEFTCRGSADLSLTANSASWAHTLFCLSASRQLGSQVPRHQAQSHWKLVSMGSLVPNDGL